MPTPSAMYSSRSGLVSASSADRSASIIAACVPPAPGLADSQAVVEAAQQPVADPGARGLAHVGGRGVGAVAGLARRLVIFADHRAALLAVLGIGQRLGEGAAVGV